MALCRSGPTCAINHVTLMTAHNDNMIQANITEMNALICMTDSSYIATLFNSVVGLQYKFRGFCCSRCCLKHPNSNSNNWKTTEKKTPKLYSLEMRPFITFHQPTIAPGLLSHSTMSSLMDQSNREDNSNSLLISRSSFKSPVDELMCSCVPAVSSECLLLSGI